MLNLKQARDVSRPDSNDVSLDREPAVVLTVAEQLRFSRERAERTLEEVAGFLKIRKVHLEALEDGRNDELPGHTYALGFVRAYSEYLGLDREVIAARFKDETAELEAKARLVFPSPMPEGRTPGAAIILIAVVCAALVYGVWMYMSSQDRSLAEVVPALPGSLQALVAPESASVAVSNLVVEAPISAPPVELLSSRTSAPASSIKLSEPVRDKWKRSAKRMRLGPSKSLHQTLGATTLRLTRCRQPPLLCRRCHHRKRERDLDSLEKIMLRPELRLSLKLTVGLKLEAAMGLCC
jgi:cytoskeletal protein RodZ